jgi:hypothetical protein
MDFSFAMDVAMPMLHPADLLQMATCSRGCQAQLTHMLRAEHVRLAAVKNMLLKVKTLLPSLARAAVNFPSSGPDPQHLLDSVEEATAVLTLELVKTLCARMRCFDGVGPQNELADTAQSALAAVAKHKFKRHLSDPMIALRTRAENNVLFVTTWAGQGEQFNDDHRGGRQRRRLFARKTWRLFARRRPARVDGEGDPSTG